MLTTLLLIGSFIASLILLVKNTPMVLYFILIFTAVMLLAYIAGSTVQ